VVVALVAGMVAYVRAATDENASRCAYFTDSIGLYTGNPVTQMGYRIGTVTRIEPQGHRVRVDFELDVDRAIPRDVKAVIRSKSVLADRSLELVGNYEAGPELIAGECIAIHRTSTPKSLSEITGSAADFLKALSPDDTESIDVVVAELDKALKGQGDNINQLLTHASGAMTDPDQMVADVGSIITSMAPLSTTTLQNWSTLKDVLAVMPKDLEVAATGLWDGVATFIDGLGPLIAVLYDAQRNYGHDINAGLDYASIGLRIAAGRSDDLKRLLGGLPAIANLVRADPGQFRIAHPWIEVKTPSASALCKSLNAVRPTSCAGAGNRARISDLGVLDAVLGQAER